MSTANPTARPPKAPPLTTMPSTPGPQVPGGYPRDSVVFSTNQWAPPEPGVAPAKAKKGKGLLAATKAYLPPAVTSYFPQTSAPPTPNAESPSTPKGEGGAPLNTDGSAASDSDFSTRAYAGTPRGEATPTQGIAFSESTTPTNGPVDLPPSKNSNLNPASAKPEFESGPVDPGVVPIPSVAPFASVLTSTGRAPTPAPPAPPPVAAADASISSSSSDFSNPNSNNSASTANTSPPASPSSPAVKKTRFVMEPMSSSPSSSPDSPPPSSPSAKGFKRFTSLRRKAAPSAFNGSGVDADAGIEDGAAPVGVDGQAPTKPKHSRRASLMRTIAAKMHIGHGGERDKDSA
ncbi:hypothetical protein DFH06DRAFT_1292546 [Mycena polygramma]|nr:hypothetical protein DFH06DRAFT_1292546 [Mycena polygramma]